MSTLKTIFGEETTILFIGDTDYDVEVYRGLGIYSIKTTGLFKCEEARRVLSIIDSFFQSTFSS
uniref:HAD family hydrolase n=1 Tax=Fervidicoccus fontis TaxID=683846 RepID=A0A7C1HXE9_9CREN